VARSGFTKSVVLHVAVPPAAVLALALEPEAAAPFAAAPAPASSVMGESWDVMYVGLSRVHPAVAAAAASAIQIMRPWFVISRPPHVLVATSVPSRGDAPASDFRPPGDPPVTRSLDHPGSRRSRDEDGADLAG
jgi:hypothetical protein